MKTLLALALATAPLLLSAQNPELKSDSMKKVKMASGGSGPIDTLMQGVLKINPKVPRDTARKIAEETYYASYENNVDPMELIAQMGQESRFAADVLSLTRSSSAGAKGIAQFMPRTAKTYNVDPGDISSSIWGMAKYMSDNINKNKKDGLGDSYARAQQRYNAGGPSLKAFLRGNKYLKETDDYPQLVAKRKKTAFKGQKPIDFLYAAHVDQSLLNDPKYAAVAMRPGRGIEADNTKVAMNLQGGLPQKGYGGKLPKYGLGAMLGETLEDPNKAQGIGTAMGIAGNLIEGSNWGGSNGGAFAGGALEGAGMGAAFGPWGMGIGAAIGGARSLLEKAAYDRQRRKELKQNNQEAYRQSLSKDQSSAQAVLSHYPTEGVLSPGFYAYGGAPVTPQYEVEKDEVIQGDNVALEDGSRLASDIVEVGGEKHHNGGTMGAGGERIFSDRLGAPSDLLKKFNIR